MSLDNDCEDSDSCEVCKLPKLFHIDNRGEMIIGQCDKYTASESFEIWKIFKQKNRPIRRWYKDILEEREEKKNNFLKRFTTITEPIMNGKKDTLDLEIFLEDPKYGDIELNTIEKQ